MPQERDSQGRETQTDRSTRRRLRRWRRRAQVVAPLLAVPAMLGLLILSVDLIEYQPSPPARSDSPREASAVRFDKAHALEVEPQSVSALSVVDSLAVGPDGFDSAVVSSASVIEGADPMRDASATSQPAR